MNRKAITIFVFALVLVFLLASCAGMAEMEEAAEEKPPADSAAPAEKKKTAESSGAAAVESAAAGAEAPATPGEEVVAEIFEKRESEAEDSETGLWSTEGEVVASAESSAFGTTATAGTTTTRSAARPEASGLKAGFAGDNKQFNYFLSFLKEYGQKVSHIPIHVQERIAFKVRDSQMKSLPNAEIVISGEDGRTLCRGKTFADGSFLFFPSEYGDERTYGVEVTCNQQTKRFDLDRQGRREILASFDFSRAAMTRIPLDLLFILDTTGSMGDEIQRLKTTIELINLNLSSLSSRPRVRFGMVLYKDRGDEYVTEVVPFTENLEEFQAALEQVDASGGGDTPEDLQSALQDAVKMSWNRSGVRLAFIITDAPPHLDYRQQYTYALAARDAKEEAIKIFSVGTGGLDLMGEVVLRQISQYTSGKYIFLTYGETGESEGGEPGSVSHHTGANYQTDKLEAIIIRFAKEELSYVTDQPIEEEEEYFTARKISEEQREQTLNKLFTMAVSQLIDYSTFRIPSGTPASILPLSPARSELSLNSEYFTEQLMLSFSQNEDFRKIFRIVARKDLQSILEELELQLSDLAEERGAARVGALLGADLLVIGKLYEKAEGYELFLKLVRVETGEVLSVTKAVIDKQLGLEA